MDALGCVQTPSDRVAQRHQRRRTGADPVGECRHVEINPLARVDVALPVERQVRAVLAEQHIGEQLRAGAAARSDAKGRWLRDRLTGAARELRARAGSPSTAPARAPVSR